MIRGLNMFVLTVPGESEVVCMLNKGRVGNREAWYPPAKQHPLDSGLARGWSRQGSLGGPVQLSIAGDAPDINGRVKMGSALVVSD